MTDAFQKLDSLTSLTDLYSVDPNLVKNRPSVIQADGMDLSTPNPTAPTTEGDGKAEGEAKLYSDLYAKLKSGETEVYDDVFSELASSDDPDSTPELTLDDADGIGSSEEITETLSLQTDLPFLGMDAYLRRAMEEALEETSKQVGKGAPTVGKMKDRIMDDKKLKGEIEKIFEKANEDLLETVEKMREEQVSLFETWMMMTMGCGWICADGRRVGWGWFELVFLHQQ